jgi:hypothetical protein
MTHDQLQAGCYKEACQLYHPLLIRRLISVPNDMAGGNVVRARHYQAIGVTAGVWDMQLNWFELLEYIAPDDIPEPVRIIPATHWFEFKVGRDVLSEKQKKFRKTMLPLNHTFYVIHTKETFLEQLKLIVEPTLHIAKQIWQEEVKYGGD